MARKERSEIRARLPAIYDDDGAIRGHDVSKCRLSADGGRMAPVDLGTQSSGVNVLNASHVNSSVRNSSELVRGGMNFKF